MGRSQMPKYIFAAVLSLAACAATPQPAPEELSEPTLYDFLLGEIALQRGDVTLAAKTYLELAKHTRDPRAAQSRWRISRACRTWRSRRRRPGSTSSRRRRRHCR